MVTVDRVRRVILLCNNGILMIWLGAATCEVINKADHKQSNDIESYEAAIKSD
jgi:hypothetical protein